MKAIVRSTVLGMLFVAAIGFIPAAALVEAAPNFHGTYAWTGFRSCVLANQPFVAPTFLIPDGAFLYA